MKVSLELERGQVCRILISLTTVANAFQEELASEDISVMRRLVSEDSLKYWRGLHAEVKRQLDLFDSF